ncbi:hypothetical protein V8F20_011459 [Naviculisporaceae sp. PSN 640]
MDSRNAIHEVALKLWKGSHENVLPPFAPRPLRFVKLLGAGGCGFAALFDTRPPPPPHTAAPPAQAPGVVPWAARLQASPGLFTGPTQVNYFVCKGVLPTQVDGERTMDVGAIDWGRPGQLRDDIMSQRVLKAARRKYRNAARELMEERETQLELSGALHIVQAYGRAHRRQWKRLRLNHTTRAVATTVDAPERRAHWADRREPSWTRRTRRSASTVLQRQVVGPHRPPPPPPREVRGAPPPPGPAPPPPVLPPRNVRPPPPPYDQSEDIDHTYDRMGSETDLLFMEYIARGDLESFISKQNQNVPANQDTPPPPNRVLWGMWECLVKMLIPLDNPPRDRRGRMNQDLFAPLESERFPLPNEPEYGQGVNFIHFDIDPQNIFLGSFDCTGVRDHALPQDPPLPAHLTQRQRLARRARDDRGQPIPPVPIPTPAERKDGHGHTPVLKLADFGLAEAWNPSDMNHPKFREDNNARAWTMARTRWCGKVRYLTPEQWSPEWDYVEWEPITQEEADVRAADPALQTRNPGTIVTVAGQYSWKSNLYQVALTMVAIITGRDPPDQPLATKIRRTIIMPSAGTRTRTDTKERWTMGGWILDDQYLPNVDRELRETLALCLCQRPDDRPNHDELMAQINEKMAYYNAVHEHHTADPPSQRRFHEWAPPLPNGAPPSERAVPDLDYIRNMAEAAVGDPPRVGVASYAAYDNWVQAIHGRNIPVRTWHQGRFQDLPHEGPNVFNIGLDVMDGLMFNRDQQPHRWNRAELGLI